MLLLKEDKNPNPTNNQTSEEKKKKRDEKSQKYNNAPICKNCGRKHPSKAKDKCWELDVDIGLVESPFQHTCL
jgi:hypothetical protein